MNSIDDIEMDKDALLLFGITACALGLSLFILWGPKLSRKGSGACSLIGLQNLGLTCFLNSLLQALASCPSFLEWLEPREENGNISSALHHILKLLCYKRHPELDDAVYSPGELIYYLRGKAWPTFPQEQDPHELFLHLISAVEEEEQKSKPERMESLLDALEPKEIQQTVCKVQSHGDVPVSMKKFEFDQPLPSPSPFRGYLASQLSCLRCGQKSAVVYDKFDTLSLALPPRCGPAIQLSRLLENFVSTELVDGFTCESCSPRNNGGTTQASKAIKIGKLPKCLCLHISRTVMDNNGFMFKRENYVDFPEFLSMSSFTHTSSMLKEKKKLGLEEMAAYVSGGDNSLEGASSENGCGVASKEHQHQTSPRTISDLGQNNNHPEAITLKGPVYRLKAVIEHRGTVDSGHFVTYRRGPLESDERHRSISESRWFFTSDDIVRKSSLSDALSASAYLLFYEKCSNLIHDLVGQH